MNFLVDLMPMLTVLAEFTDRGLAYIAIGMCGLSMMASGLGEGYLCSQALLAMGRNPEMYSKLRTSMILGCALDETTGIYGLVIAILCLVL